MDAKSLDSLGSYFWATSSPALAMQPWGLWSDNRQSRYYAELRKEAANLKEQTHEHEESNT
jgi:hypothetical protein